VSITLDVNVDDLKRRLLEQAAKRGQAPAAYAEHIVGELEAVARQAEGITDEEAKELLLVSALENTIPQLFDGTSPGASAAAIVLFLILGIISTFHQQRSHETDAWTALQEKYTQAGEEATVMAHNRLREQGIGIVYEQDGVVVEELPDGTIRPFVSAPL